MNQVKVPTILRLTISRFRGIKSLDWYPAGGLNVILGGGDVGKTTVLSAVGLLLSPTNQTPIWDTEYYSRDTDAGFIIEAVFKLPPDSGVSNQLKPSWPWHWNGNDAVVPSTGGNEQESEPAYKLRVSGSPDLEPLFEIVQPDGTTDPLSVGLRRGIGLVRLVGDDLGDRDLRLVQGSALDRLLSDRTLRGKLRNSLADTTDVKNCLAPEAKTAMEKLDAAFQERALPHKLDLAITGGGQGTSSIAALIGLTAERGDCRLPMVSWGAGTRRLAALTIAAENQGETPVTLVDEIERGLEPYRQRALVEDLQKSRCQVFVTTHSPTVIATAAKAHIWYLDHAGNIGEIAGAATERLRKNDPNVLLARLALVAEGVTEQGFVTALLEKAVGPLPQYGIHVCDGAGHDAALEVLQAFSKAHLQIGGFVDNEAKHTGRWKEVKEALGDLLFQWDSGCIEANIINLLPDDKLPQLICDPTDRKTGYRLRSLADRLGSTVKDLETIEASAGAGLKQLILDTALGKVPDGTPKEQAKAYRSETQTWFKTFDGGRELAEKSLSLGIWGDLKSKLLPFCNSVREAIGLSKIGDLSP